MTNELEILFADANRTRTPVKRKAPIDPLVKLQKALDELTGTGANRCDLSKAVAPTPVRKREVILKQTERRNFAFISATGDESLATLTSRQKGGSMGIAKAEDSVDIAPGFTSMSRLTGKY